MGEEVSKATNKRVEVCSIIDVTFGFGPGGNFLTGSRVSLLYENAWGYSKS